MVGMNSYDFSALRRELIYHDFMIHYLQEEQKKRWEELRDFEKRLERLKADPAFRKLVELAERMKEEPVAEQARARRSRAKRATRAASNGPY